MQQSTYASQFYLASDAPFAALNSATHWAFVSVVVGVTSTSTGKRLYLTLVRLVLRYTRSASMVFRLWSVHALFGSMRRTVFEVGARMSSPIPHLMKSGAVIFHCSFRLVAVRFIQWNFCLSRCSSVIRFL